MAEHRPPFPVKPRPKPVRVIGVLNIVLGAVLLGYSSLMLAGMAFNGMSSGPSEALERVLTEQAGRDLDAKLDRLSGLEADAEHEAAKAVYRAERQRLEQRGPAIDPQAQMVLMNGRMGSMVIWTAADALSALVLNLLMVLSGVVLVQRVEWGRRLAVWVAGLKLVRLAAAQAVWLAVIVPALSRAIGQSVGDMMAAGGGGPPAGMPNMTQLYAVIYSAWGIFSLIVGSIYPIVTLVLLTRPGVRAACQPAELRARAVLAEANRP